MTSKEKIVKNKSLQTNGSGKIAKKSNFSSSNLSSLKKNEHLNLFRKMYLIRQFENACGQNYANGNIRGFLHLYSGQEATGVGAISSLKDSDYIVTHYRDHGHALARGLDVNRSMAELFGKKTGLSKGKGGSMHLFDASKKFMGGHAIVGGQLPLAAGLALSQQYENKNAITTCFFGDGSTNQGIYHETLNLASVWNLPILFFLENNKYGMGSSIERVRAGGLDFFPAMDTYEIPSMEVDGMDVIAVKEATKIAREKIIQNKKPFFIESKTFRFVGHSYADGQKYRHQDEVKQWEQKDPILVYPKKLIDMKISTNDEINKIKIEIDEIISDAVRFANESEEPNLDEIYDDILAE
ncbi:MAG: pyruvate dehydrogenase (acetyl-transferring) E1 component subunit alpha [Chloroflexi bacterium]|nr:pyruvate dehydrogenase (acetyl-transferring) E1 component subunit alpha [Chloroflexota bacterium]